MLKSICSIGNRYFSYVRRTIGNHSALRPSTPKFILGGLASIAAACAPTDVQEWTDVSFCQKPRECSSTIAGHIDNARDYVYIAIFDFNLLGHESDIIDALIDAQKRGVEIKIVSDNSRLGEEREEAIARELFERGRIQVRKDKNSGFMHLKILVADDVYCMGSFNWTRPADQYYEGSEGDKNNQENLECKKWSSVARAYANHVLGIWNNGVPVDFQSAE